MAEQHSTRYPGAHGVTIELNKQSAGCLEWLRVNTPLPWVGQKRSSCGSAWEDFFICELWLDLGVELELGLF